MIMKQHYFKKAMAVFLSFTTISVLADDVVTTLPATDITQTKATLQAEFIEGSTSNGFEYKYGTIPELDDFASLLLTETSDPVTFTQGTKAWRAVNSRGWVESYYDNTSTSLTSDISTQFTVTEATPVTFEWSVSSQENVGKLQFLVDGTVVQSITGEVDFVAVSYELPAGQHTLKWQYKRSTTESTGDGIGKLRHLTIHNTTEGEWLNWPATSNTARLEYLYPSQNYLFRAYSTIGEKKVYSSIRQFRSLGISLGTPRVVSTTQTTATVECDVDAGDAEVETGFYLTNEIVIANSEASSGAGTGATNSFSLKAPPVLHKPSPMYSSDSQYKPDVIKDSYWVNGSNSVYCNAIGTGNSCYLSIDLTLDNLAVLSFDSSVRSGLLSFYKDDTNMQWENNSPSGTTAKTCICLLSPGTHKLVWKTTQNTGVILATVMNVRIVDVNHSSLAKVSVSDGKMTYKITDMGPDSTLTVVSYMSPIASHSLIDRWPLMGGYEIVKTQDVKTSTIPARDIRQSSATICAIIESGDATIVERGMEYKNSLSQTWINTDVTENEDTLFANISSLQPNTSYDYRSFIRATNSKKKYSETASFTTASIRAQVPMIIKLTQTRVQLKGQVDYGDAHVYGVGMQVKAEEDDEWVTKEFVGEGESFSFEFENLKIGSPYMARTYVERSGGMIYSDTLLFITRDLDLSIDSITCVNQRTAVVHGIIDYGDASLPEVKQIRIYESTESYKGKDNDEMYNLMNYGITDIESTNVRFSQRVNLRPGKIYGFALKGVVDGKEFYMEKPNVNVPTVELNNPAFIKSLTSSNSSQYCSLTQIDSYWNSYNSYVQCSRSSATLGYNMPFAISFELKEEAEVTFKWSVSGIHSYKGSVSGNTIYQYSNMTCYVDGNWNSSISTSGVNSGTISVTLSQGMHTIRWETKAYGSFVGKVWDLVIPRHSVQLLTDTERLCYTPFFFEEQKASDITQTTATLQANIIPTNEEGMEYYFSPNKSEKTWQDIEEEFGRLSDEEKEKYWHEWGYDIEAWAAETDAWHNNERIPTSVKDSVFNADLVNLEPDTEYTYYAVAKTSDDQKYEEKIQFKTLSVGISITVSNITQTTAVVNVSTDSGTATISNLQYNIDNGEWKALSNYVITLTGLTPNNSYRVNLRWDVNGKTYNNYVTLKTASVNVYAASVTAAQTSALLRMGSLSVGTATKTASGIVFEGETYSLNPNDTIRLKELKPATNYTYTYFVDTEEGGRVSNIGKFNTTAITAVTLPVTNISNRSATLNGTIDCDDHSSAEFGFQWKEKTGWTTDPRFTKGRKGDDGNISVALVNGMLKPDTEYEYRTAVRYQGQIYYAPTWSDFRTELEYVYYPATAYTIFRTDSENNRLILCGYYLAGSEQVLSQGYQYWQTNSWESRSLTSDNTQVNTIVTDSTMLAELDLATLNNGVYQVRAFVNTENETVYGQTLSFQVGQAPDAIIEAKMSNPECFVQRRTIVLSHVKGLYATVADLTGRIYWSGISNNESLQVPLSSGVYLVHLNSGHIFKVQVR